MEEVTLIANKDSKSLVSEAYRTIRTNLKFSSTVGKRVKTIIVTSSLPNEGKSTVITNLGIVLAQAGYKTIILDCDLRKPKLHKTFGINNIGISNSITSGANIMGMLQHSNLEENLWLVAAGPIPPNPSELLASEEMDGIITKCTECFDYVLIDTPPIIPVTDAAILATKVDGVIVVIESERIKPAIAKEMKDRLVNNGANILGVILNKLDVDNGHNYGYEYYHYYGERD